MKIYIEVPDNTLALIATYIYPDEEHQMRMNMGAQMLDSENIWRQREAAECETEEEGTEWTR